MLYLVATPIGNLSDITHRAIAILSAAEYILCEDTRHSKHLLTHYKISTPCRSYHKFNESFREEPTIQDLKAGKNIALISDAGTPGISDPGETLVKRCAQEQIQVVSIPGPCAAIAAITCSALSTCPFQFVGFLPRKAGERKKALIKIFEYEGATICYESPNRLLDVVKDIAEMDPERPLAIARELTKLHEEVLRGSAQDLLHQLHTKTIKGEIVLMIGRGKSDQKDWNELTPEEHVAFLEKNYKISRQEAIKLAATQRGVSKREIYRQAGARSQESGE